MRRSTVLSAVAAALAVGTAACVPGPGPGPAPGGGSATDCATRKGSKHDVSIVGLVADGTLVCFSEQRTALSTIGVVSGLVQDTGLIGMDYRPANDTLYAVGNAGGVYTLDASNAVATLVSRLNQPLQGTSFGVDFNPAVDRLRIVSDSGQNLRVNVDDGTTAPDGTLNIPGTTPVNPALGVAGAAYTNNDADPSTVTTLFDIDTTNDNTVVQAPANSGSLSPTGKLGVDATTAVGFDIYSELRDGTTVSQKGLASIATADGATRLYGIDLLVGRATAIGTFDQPIVEIAIPTDQR